MRISELLNTSDVEVVGTNDKFQCSPAPQTQLIGSTLPAQAKILRKHPMEGENGVCTSESPRAIDDIIVTNIAGKGPSPNICASANNVPSKKFTNGVKENEYARPGAGLQDLIDNLMGQVGLDKAAQEIESENKSLGVVCKGESGKNTEEVQVSLLPNRYVDNSEMDCAMGSGYLLRTAAISKAMRKQDMLQTETEGSKGRREKRRMAAKAARMEREMQSDNDLSGLESLKALEKRMKNRAAVNKCRLKQKERIERLESERFELERENRVMKEFVVRLGKQFDIESGTEDGGYQLLIERMGTQQES